MFSKLLKAALWVFDKLLLLFLIFFILILSLGSYILYPLLFSHESASLDSSGTQPPHTGSQIYRLSWQEPFDYEVKIYANHYEYIGQNETDFFEGAQLLWHIPLLSLADKYPQLKHKTTMKIPRKVIRNKRFKKRLYAHVFVQRVGKFTPHPDITDPDLFVLRYSIAWWQNPQETRGWKSNFSDDAPLELMTATALPLSIVLENQEYRKEKMPLHLYDATFNTPWFTRMDNTYAPSISINQYTRSPIHFMPKVAMRSDKRAGGPHDLDVDLELELEGIRRAWIIIKEAAFTYSFPGQKYKHDDFNLRDLVVAEGYNPDIPDHQIIVHRPLALVEKTWQNVS
ncbi:hypothetical protein LPJ56_001640 [Coemansia sp. RSA 2599]|nr:hypothetical protein LPJ56_001640 [Coemansia sp. RSA 2599]